MNLYQNKEANIRKTYLLFVVFLGVVIGLGWVFTQIYGNSAILIFAVIFACGMSIVSYWYSDKIVLGMARARLVKKEDARDLYNTVENLAITAGLPLPKIYIIDEAAPNAFATGRNPEHAVVAVTTGLLAKLNKTELEGVLAHELSHVGNRDILISTAAVILAGFIALLADFFMRSMLWGSGRRRSDSGDGGQLQMIMMLVGVVLSILAPIAATLMQLAISRKREFLADSSGALLTRYPEGLASALEKIALDPTPLRAAQNTTAHLWFDDPFTSGIGRQKKVSSFHKLFMTHPPVEERIAALRGMVK